MLKNPTPNGNYRPVNGFPDYLIDDRGNVWGRRCRGCKRLSPFWIIKLKQSKSDLGYMVVGLSRNGRQKMMRIHHLVLLSFGFKRPSPKHETRHLNGNRADNRLSNLAWGTHQENMDDMIRHGQAKGNRKHLTCVSS